MKREQELLKEHKDLSKELTDILKDFYGDVGDLEGSDKHRADQISSRQDDIEDTLFSCKIPFRVKQVSSAGVNIKVMLDKGFYIVDVGIVSKQFDTVEQVDYYLLGYYDAV